jgi:hypothetical protein
VRPCRIAVTTHSTLLISITTDTLRTEPASTGAMQAALGQALSLIVCKSDRTTELALVQRALYRLNQRGRKESAGQISRNSFHSLPTQLRLLRQRRGFQAHCDAGQTSSARRARGCIGVRAALVGGCRLAAQLNTATARDPSARRAAASRPPSPHIRTSRDMQVSTRRTLSSEPTVSLCAAVCFAGAGAQRRRGSAERRWRGAGSSSAVRAAPRSARFSSAAPTRPLRRSPSAVRRCFRAPIPNPGSFALQRVSGAPPPPPAAATSNCKVPRRHG